MRKKSPARKGKELCPDCDGEGCESCGFTGEDQSNLDDNIDDELDLSDLEDEEGEKLEF